MAKNRNIQYDSKPVDQTPMVNGYKMVPQSTPMRQATTYQKRPVVEQSPMITWGKIEGAMFLGMEKSPFRIA